jgi:hypothetical protein
MKDRYRVYGERYKGDGLWNYEFLFSRHTPYSA